MAWSGRPTQSTRDYASTRNTRLFLFTGVRLFLHTRVILVQTEL